VNAATGVASSVIDDDVHPRDTTRSSWGSPGGLCGVRPAPISRTAIGFIPAVPVGLQGMFFLNGLLEKAARNLVVARASTSVIGSCL